jgi:methanogenic corrinoid protein MtbC1
LEECCIFIHKNRKDWNDTFLRYLLYGDYKACFALTEQYLAETNDLTTFYLQVIQPCLYEIGRLWEGGHVSVAQEHLATAIVSRIMLTRSGNAFSECGRGKAVIACAPHELHELGGRMVADLLEKDGWQVKFLGAGLSVAELLKYLQSYPPQFIGISTSMPFNIDSAKEVIVSIRQDVVLKNVKIMIGGTAFHYEDLSWRKMGADAYAVDGAAAVKIAKNWPR